MTIAAPFAAFKVMSFDVVGKRCEADAEIR